LSAKQQAFNFNELEKYNFIDERSVRKFVTTIVNEAEDSLNGFVQCAFCLCHWPFLHNRTYYGIHEKKTCLISLRLYVL